MRCRSSRRCTQPLLTSDCLGTSSSLHALATGSASKTFRGRSIRRYPRSAILYGFLGSFDPHFDPHPRCVVLKAVLTFKPFGAGRQEGRPYLTPNALNTASVGSAQNPVET